MKSPYIKFAIQVLVIAVLLLAIEYIFQIDDFDFNGTLLFVLILMNFIDIQKLETEEDDK